MPPRSLWAEIALLMRLRGRAAHSSIRFAPPVQRWIGGILGVGALALFIGISVAFAGLLRVTEATTGAATRDALAGQAVYFLFLFLLASGIPFVSGVLFAPGDLPLLAGAPIRPAALVVARLWDATVAASGQFVVIGVPLLAAILWSVGPPVWAWLIWLWLVALFLALPALLIALPLLVLARIIGMRRVRTTVALVSAALSLGLCLLTVAEFSHRSAHGGASVLLTGDTPAAPPSLPLRVLATPARWTTDTLLACHAPRAARLLPPLAGLTLLTVALAVACGAVGGATLVGEQLLEGESGGAGWGGSRLDTLLHHVPGLSPATGAFIGKDIRYIVRDLVLLSQIGVPLILFFVPFVIGTQLGGRGGPEAGDFLWLSLAIVGMIAYIETSILSLSSVGLEGQGFWIVQAAPVSPAQFLRAKWLVAWVVSLILTLPLHVIACLFWGAPGAVVAGGAAVLVTTEAALCGLGVGLSGLFPRFVYDNPAHRASLSSLIGGFFGATVYVIVVGVAVGGGLYLAPQWPERAGAIYAGAGVIFVVLSLATGIVPMLMAQARLTGYAPDA